MITIHNLTERQRAIAELLWTCDSAESVQTLIDALPQDCVLEARSLITVILQESMEDEGMLDMYEESALEVIRSVR